ncbi:MAG TPA: PAS domain-containing protein, partial [Burkholderiaceae bacterium]|nr:PAS domain-containing protein [Burkholderiaceae bacterium]
MAASAMIPDGWSLDPDSIPLPALRLGLDGVILQVNAAATKLFGRTAQALRETSFEDLLTAGGRTLYHTQLLPALRASGKAAGSTL